MKMTFKLCKIKMNAGIHSYFLKENKKKVAVLGGSGSYAIKNAISWRRFCRFEISIL
jgi:hypothetical protein